MQTENENHVFQDEYHEYDNRKCEVNITQDWGCNYQVSDTNKGQLCILSSLDEAIAAGNYAMSPDGGYSFVQVLPTNEEPTHNSMIEWVME